MEPSQHNIQKSNPVQTSQPTIGFLISVNTPFVVNLWRGGFDAAREHDANFVCFVGDIICPAVPPFEYRFRAQANIGYELINPEHFDGLVLCSSILLVLIQLEEFKCFCARYRPLPMISIAVPVEGLSSVMVDNYAGMYEVVHHLINVHGYRRIAFIQGPEKSQEAQERYRAYTDALADHSIEFDAALVAPGSFFPPAGEDAVRLFLDERHLRPRVDIEAIVAANDTMAFTALEALQARGFHVPHDVAIAGFDDSEEARAAVPPITTVRMSSYELGYQATTMLIAKIRGEAVPKQVNIPTQLVVHQSCGCVDQEVTQATAGLVTGTGETFETFFAERQDELIREIDHLMKAREVRIDAHWITSVLDGFVAGIKGTSEQHFLSALDLGLHHVSATGGDVTVWHDALSELRRQVLPYLGSAEPGSVDRDRAENLWQQARVMIGGAAKRAQEYRIIQWSRQTTTLREIGAGLMTTYNIMELMEMLAEYLPRLGIASCYLSLYEDPHTHAYLQPAPEWSRLILAYNDRGRVPIESGGQRFLSRDLIPRQLSPHNTCYSLVVEPLFFREEQLGFGLFGANPHEVNPYDNVYEALRREISNALHGALLMQREQEHSAEIARRNAEIARRNAEIARRNAEIARRNAEIARQKYILDMFLENVPDSIYFKDRESRITHANKAHARRAGFSDPAEELGKTDFDFFPEEQAQMKHAQEQAIMQTGQPILALEESDGQGHWELTTKMPLRDEHGTIVGTVGISRDITPSKQVEAFLRKLEKAMETTEVGITITDNDGRIVYLNPAEAQMHGYTVDELLRQPANIFAPPEFREPRENAEVERVLWKRERTNIRKDGTIFPVRLISNPISDPEGHLLGKVTVCEDITERKQAEQALLAAHEELKEKNAQLAELNVSKDTFFSIISHDLRSPFTALLGLTELLDEQFDLYPPETVKRYIGKLHRAAERLYALLENLLTWSRIQRGAMTYTPLMLDLNAVVEESFDLWRSHAERKQIVLQHTIPPQISVYADSQMLETVLRNLLSNALKFTSSGGLIEVSARPQKTKVEIAITDTGVGIRSEDLPKLFRIDTHFTHMGTAGEQGTGLGLSLCKDLVKKNGGDIWVESVLSQGTTFRFTVPIDDAAYAVNVYREAANERTLRNSNVQKY